MSPPRCEPRNANERTNDERPPDNRETRPNDGRPTHPDAGRREHDAAPGTDQLGPCRADARRPPLRGLRRVRDGGGERARGRRPGIPLLTPPETSR